MPFAKSPLWLVPAFLTSMSACAGAADAPASDPFLAPAGIVLGMKLSEAQAAAKAAGFVEKGACAWSKSTGEQVRLETGESQRCAAEAPVIRIDYRWKREALLDAGSVVEDLSGRFGEEAACKALLAGNAQCAWNKPANYPLVHVADVDVVGKTVHLTLNAVVDLQRTNTFVGEYPKAFDPLAGIGELDPLSPGGVAIGAPIKDVRESLIAAEFTPAGYSAGHGESACAWTFERKYEVEARIQVRATITHNGAARTTCEDGAIIEHVEYQKTDYRPAAFAKAPAAGEGVAAWARRLGKAKEAPPCAERPGVQDSLTVECAWGDFAGEKSLASAKIRVQTRPANTTNTAYILLEGGNAP